MNRKRHPGHPRLLWEQEISKFKESGLSGAAYCREHGLSYGKFASWRKKLRNPQADNRPKKLFSRVEVGDSGGVPTRSEVSIRFPNGVTLTASSLPDPEWLLQVGGTR